MNWLLYPWNSPGKNTGVGILFLLQGIFPTQGSNLGLLDYRQILYCVNHEGSLQNVSGLIQLTQVNVSWLPSSLLHGTRGLQDHGRRERGNGGDILSSLLDPVVTLLILLTFLWPELITYSYPNCQRIRKCR